MCLKLATVSALLPVQIGAQVVKVAGAEYTLDARAVHIRGCPLHGSAYLGILVEPLILCF